MFDNLREDLNRVGPGAGRRLRLLVFSPALWAIVGYRYRRWVFVKRPPQPFRWLLNLAGAFVETWTDVTSNIQIPASASIGPGLMIAHTGYIVLSATTVLGHHCTLTQGVTIGHAGGGGAAMNVSPVIGDRVYIGPGAAIIGPIVIGDDALVGVGAVVTSDVPPRGVAVGNPARVISMKGSFELVAWPGMENDPARRAAREDAADPAPPAAGHHHH